MLTGRPWSLTYTVDMLISSSSTAMMFVIGVDCECWKNYAQWLNVVLKSIAMLKCNMASFCQLKTKICKCGDIQYTSLTPNITGHFAVIIVMYRTPLCLKINEVFKKVNFFYRRHTKKEDAIEKPSSCSVAAASLWEFIADVRDHISSHGSFITVAPVVGWID